MKRNLSLFKNTKSGAIYRLADAPDNVEAFVASTEFSRQICNDPFCLGLEYTTKLSLACSEVLAALPLETLQESRTVVTHILRGGLNFGLREALGQALNWNLHNSAFLSAQRVNSKESPDDWFITEDSYKKVDLPEQAAIVMGDVVATGTSLSFALNALGKIASQQKISLSQLIFFTIGGGKTEEIIGNFVANYKQKVPSFRGAKVIYLEGCFAVAEATSPLQIKIPGTDLLRRDSLVAPEFLNSQKQNPCYPLERCTIYDAGSRAFHVKEYLEDVKDYWESNLRLANNGVTFKALLAERLPEVDAKSFGDVSLSELCNLYLSKLNELLHR